LHQFKCCDSRQPRIERAGAKRSRDHEDFQRGHILEIAVRAKPAAQSAASIFFENALSQYFARILFAKPASTFAEYAASN
jgi:hypothetical protein